MKRGHLLASLMAMLTLFTAGCGQSRAGELVVKIRQMGFDQSEIRVPAGEPVTLTIVNEDGYTHAFDVDEFDIHLPLAAETTIELSLAALEPGRYAFYCGAPGHVAAGMTGTLIVSP